MAPAEGLHGADHMVSARYSDFAICSCGGLLQICQWYRVCDAGGLGLMLRARRGARENDYPVPFLRTHMHMSMHTCTCHMCTCTLHTTTKALSLLSSLTHSGGSQLPSPATSCHVADRERISSCSARRVAKAKVLPEPPGALTTWRRSPLACTCTCRDARGGALWGGAQPGQQ